MKILKLFNRRKREIERLNGVVAQLQQELRMCNTFATTTNADKLKVEKGLIERNNEVFALKEEVRYLNMKLNNTENKNELKYY
jgi:hypothetical protein